MPPKHNPWQEISKSGRKLYQPLVDYVIPAVRLKPLDLWVNLRAHHRIAIPKHKLQGPHRHKIQMTIHYIWDAPTRSKLRSMRPGWSTFTIEHWLERFERHMKRWGPGDVELVTLTLERRRDSAAIDSLDPSHFTIDKICYRTGAHMKGVLKQAWEGDWDKLGNKRVRYAFAEVPFEMLNGRPLLTIDSYHHSFFEPGRVPARALKWPNAVIPRSSYFPEEAWEYFKVAENNRGCEPWQAA